MQSESQQGGFKATAKRQSLLVEMFKNQNSNSGKPSPRDVKSGESSPVRRSSSIRTPTSVEKENDSLLYKQAYNAIVDRNLEAIDQVLFQLSLTERNINSPLKTKSLDGKALIHLVAETMDKDDYVMTYIIEQKGATTDLIDSLGNNALHLACRAGKLETVKFLQSKGIDLSLKNKLGDYSVSFAAFSGNLELVKYLQNQGVAIDQRNQDNLTPLDIAYDKNHQEIVDFLLENYDMIKQ